MKTIASTLLLLVLSIPTYGRSRAALSQMTVASPASLSVTAVAPDLPRRLLFQAKAHALARRAASAGRARTAAVIDSASSGILLIPAAGSLPGGGGALFFRSDVTLVNYSDKPQLVMAGLWPQGGGSTGDFLSYKSITLPPQTFVTFQDFVGTTLGLNALGSLIFIPFKGTELDFNAAIDGFSRIYTRQPGSTGTVSQPFDAVNPDTLSVALIEKSIALGLRQDSSYRTNYGIVNVDDVDRTFQVTFIGDRLQTTLTVTVKGFGMVQQSIPAGDYGAVQIVFELLDPPPESLPFVAYASSTDNITGDGWVSLASAGLTPEQLILVGY